MSCHELYMRGVSSCKNVQIVYLPGFTHLAVEARLIPVQTAGQGETRRDIQAITFTTKRCEHMDHENNRRALDLGPRLFHELPLGWAVVLADLRLAPCVVGLGRGLFLVLFSAGLGTGLRLAFRLSLRLAFHLRLSSGSCHLWFGGFEASCQKPLGMRVDGRLRAPKNFLSQGICQMRCRTWGHIRNVAHTVYILSDSHHLVWAGNNAHKHAIVIKVHRTHHTSKPLQLSFRFVIITRPSCTHSFFNFIRIILFMSLFRLSNLFGRFALLANVGME